MVDIEFNFWERGLLRVKFHDGLLSMKMLNDQREKFWSSVTMCCR